MSDAEQTHTEPEKHEDEPEVEAHLFSAGTHADGTHADGTHADGTHADGTHAD
jgi:hypothetical protein